MKLIPWTSSRELHVGENGKHELSFSPESPILLRRLRFSPDYRMTPNHHDYFEISLIYEGSGSFWNMGRKTRVKAGDALIVGDHQFHTLESDFLSPLSVLCVFFMPECIYRPGGSPIDFELLRPFFNSFVHLRGFLEKKTERGGTIRQNFELLERIMDSAIPLAAQRAKLLLSTMLLQIALQFRQNETGERRRANRRVLDIGRLQPVFEFLEGRLAEKVSLDRAAQLACMSPSYFCRFFRQVTGTRLMEYLTRMRIDRAKELLLKGGLPITQIALETGFEHLSYFDRIFRKYTRMTPQEFARRFAA